MHEPVDVWSDEVNDCRESLYFILAVAGSIVVLILYLILCCKCCRKRKEKPSDVEKSPQNVEIPKVEPPEKPKREDSPAKSSPSNSPAESGGETPPPVPKRPTVSRGLPPALPSAPKPRLSPTTPQSDTSPRVEPEPNPPAPSFPYISLLSRETEDHEEPANPEPREPQEPQEPQEPREPQEPQSVPEPRETSAVFPFPPVSPPNQSDSVSETPQMPPILPPEKPARLPPKLPPRPKNRTSTSGSITAGMHSSTSGNSGNSGNLTNEINEAIYPKPSRHVEAPARHVDFPPSHVPAANEMMASPAEKHTAPWNESSVFLNPADVTIAGNRCTLRNMAYEMDIVEMSQVPRLSEAQLSREKEFWSQLYHPGIVRVPKIGGISRVVYRVCANRGREQYRA